MTDKIQDDSGQEKPFWDHIDELRDRIMKCVYVLFIATILCYLVREPILEFLKAPLFAALPEGKRQLYITGLFESFFNHLQVSTICGALLSMPIFIYQIWAFIAPGLHVHERKYVIPFIFAGTCFFILGAAFAYYIVFPQGFKFFIEYGQPQDQAIITVKEYFGVVLRLFLLFGLSFEFPVLLILLAVIGLVNAEMLRKHRNNVIIGIAVVCAVCAPPDVLSMIVMMIPLYLFYEGSILLISFMEKKKKAKPE